MALEVLFEIDNQSFDILITFGPVTTGTDSGWLAHSVLDRILILESWSLLVASSASSFMIRWLQFLRFFGSNLKILGKYDWNGTVFNFLWY